MVFPILSSLVLFTQMIDSNYQSSSTEAKAIDFLMKDEKRRLGTPKVNISVIICYNDRSFLPIDFTPCDFIAIIYEYLEKHELEVKYISFSVTDDAARRFKNTLSRIASGVSISKLPGTAHLITPKPTNWGDGIIVDKLLDSPIRRKGKVRNLVGTGDLYYVGLRSSDKCVITFEREQPKENWELVEKMIGPIVNSIYKDAAMR